MWIWVVLLVVVVVVVVFVTQARRKSGAGVTPEQIEEAELRLSYEGRVAVGAAIAQRRKILAIKLYRDDTGASLATSKAAVETWYNGING